MMMIITAHVCYGCCLRVCCIKDQTDGMQYKIASVTDDEIRVKRVRCE